MELLNRQLVITPTLPFPVEVGGESRVAGWKISKAFRVASRISNLLY